MEKCLCQKIHGQTEHIDALDYISLSHYFVLQTWQHLCIL